MIYLDGSALLALLRTEEPQVGIQGAWERADRRVTSSIAYVEVRARLAEVRAAGRFSAALLQQALHRFEELWRDIGAVEPTPAIIGRAGDIATDGPISALAALHIATAELMFEDIEAFVTTERRVAEAARRIGLRVLGTS